jgi:membrane associated rhomboid family serine protease
VSDPGEHWIAIGSYAAAADAQADALVLAAVGIGSHIVVLGHGLGLLVAERDAVRAHREIQDYRRENRALAEPPLRPHWEGIDATLAAATLLFVLFVAQVRGMFGFDWEGAGEAVAGLVQQGEWWRAFTALGLHGSLDHLASNLFAGGAIALLLSQVLGPGLAWLAILLCGGFGNLADDLFRPAGFTSIGASTAVFAGLGLLAALMWRRRAARWRTRLRSWLPLAAALMLLAFLGTGGEDTDVGAHIAGFGTGLVGGLILYLLDKRIPQGPRAQRIYGAAAFAIFAASWILAWWFSATAQALP